MKKFAIVVVALALCVAAFAAEPSGTPDPKPGRVVCPPTVLVSFVLPQTPKDWSGGSGTVLQKIDHANVDAAAKQLVCVYGKEQASFRLTKLAAGDCKVNADKISFTCK